MCESMNFYVYYKVQGLWCYERTCSTEYSAKKRVGELKRQGREEVTYTTAPIEGALY